MTPTQRTVNVSYGHFRPMAGMFIYPLCYGQLKHALMYRPGTVLMTVCTCL
jgi:hypothetical protein